MSVPEIPSRTPAGTGSRKDHAYRLIILFGIVALLGDFVYEGARSVAGPFLFTLGASAFTVAFVAGFGEFAGYAIRIATGYLADRSKRYWVFVIAGYLMIGAIPFLVLAGSWEIAALLLITERIGKAFRSPSKDTILSHATVAVGRGWGFGLHEALDQIGAVAGPLLFVFALAAGGDYRGGFGLLAIPFVLLVVALFFAWRSMPDPSSFEPATHKTAGDEKAKDSRHRLRTYAIFTALTMAGFAVFPLLAFHFKALSVVPDAEIPALYAIAMAVDAIVALAAGKAYDRYGPVVLGAMPLAGIAIPLIVFSPSYAAALTGAVFWGASMGMQETVLRAAVADFTPPGGRGFAYGVFNTLYGGAWFAGSLAIGALYEAGTGYAAFFMVLMQSAALATFVFVWPWGKRQAKGGPQD
jgi:MFS family permease